MLQSKPQASTQAAGKRFRSFVGRLGTTAHSGQQSDRGAVLQLPCLVGALLFLRFCVFALRATVAQSTWLDLFATLLRCLSCKACPLRSSLRQPQQFAALGLAIVLSSRRLVRTRCAPSCIPHWSLFALCGILAFPCLCIRHRLTSQSRGTPVKRLFSGQSASRGAPHFYVRKQVSQWWMPTPQTTHRHLVQRSRSSGGTRLLCLQLHSQFLLSYAMSFRAVAAMKALGAVGAVLIGWWKF